MTRLPRIMEITLCREYVVDPTAHGPALIGLFQSITSSKFPFRAPLFTIYLVLYDGEGEGALRVTISRANDEQDVYRFTKWVGLSREHSSIQVFPIRRCLFPSAGRYMVQVHFDNVLISGRILNTYSG